MEHLTDLVTPHPNLNGNSYEQLARMAADIHNGITLLIGTMRKGCDLWHGRNFQTFKDGQDKQRQAMQAWSERAKWLTEFELEIEVMRVEMQREQRR